MSRYVRSGGVYFAAVLAGTMAVAAVVMPSLGVLAAFVIEDLGLSRTQFGWLVTSIAAVTALGGPPAGRLVDRIGGRRVVVMLLGANAMAVLLIAGAPSFSWLVPLAMLSGLPNASGNPAANSLIANHLSPGSRGITMGVKQSGVQFGIFAVGISLPALALAVGWRGAFVAIAVVALLMAVTAATVLPEDPPMARREATHRRYRHSPDVRWITAYAVLMGAAGATMTTFLPLYATQVLDFAATPAGASVALVGLFGIGSRIWAARYAERLAHFPSLLGILAIGAVVAIGTLVIAPFSTRWLLWVAAILAGITLMAWNAVANLAAVSLVPLNEAGRASGMINLGFMAGFTGGPVVFGSLADAFDDYTVAWTAMLLLCLAAAALMLVWSSRTRASPHTAGFHGD